LKPNIDIRLIIASEIISILPLLSELGNNEVEKSILKARLLEMTKQNYECAGVFDGVQLIGICGLWFQTRHYAGRSIEMDHVIIEERYRSQGIGAQLLDFVYDYALDKKCLWVELNTYVDNVPSHKFYANHGFVAKGYHFVKTL
jgi:GNAT superfamily N-acetyltransferase